MDTFGFIFSILVGLSLFYVLYRFFRDKSKMLEQDSSFIFVVAFILLSTLAYIAFAVCFILFGIFGLVG